MRIIRCGFIALCLTVGAINSAAARVNIDLNLSFFPELVPVPGYPVYYAPAIDSNYFFYDGRYWLFDDDDWYVSDWYNGPWEYVEPDFVPLYVLRIPVRYYRRPPPYFRGWYYDAPPRWGYHWGYGWERRHYDWDRWDHRHIPARAPIPYYQRDYSHDRYPDRDEQHEIHERNYRYQPHDVERREHDRDAWREHEAPRADRRDDEHWQRADDPHREMPRPHDFREDSNSRGRDNNPQFDRERIKRVQPVPQMERHDSRPEHVGRPPEQERRPPENASREHPQPHDNNHARDRDNGGGRENRSDRGEDRR